MITEKETTPGEVPVIAGGMKPSYYHSTSNRSQAVTTVSASGANAGHIGYWDVPIWASDCTTVEPDDSGSVAGRFMFHQLKAMETRIQATLRRGAAQPHVYAKDIAGLEVFLPPFEEQRRIASILDAADELRTKRQQAINQLDTLTQAIFHDMFGDPFRPGGATVELKQLAQVVMGQSPPGSSYNELGDGFPLLNGPTEFGERHPVATQWTSSPTRFSEVGDILFCVRGATAGRLNWADASYCIGRGIAAVRAQQEIARFLFTVLEAYYPRFQVMGTGSTFINISKNDLMSLPIPKASESAISKYGVAMQEIETEKRAAVSHVGSLGVLFASLQQRAFRGDL